MALIITLKPGEQVAINGAVLVNGDRRVSFAVQNRARILRERDVLRREDATTPAKRLYYALMLIYLDGDGGPPSTTDIGERFAAVVARFSDPAALRRCEELAYLIAENNHYKALTAARDLIAFEERLESAA